MLHRDRAGIGRYIWELQQAMADLRDPRHDVTLLLDPRDRQHRGAALPVRSGPAPARHRLERATLGWELRAFGAAHFPDHALPPGVRKPSVVTVHDVSFLTHPASYEPRSLDFYRAASQRLSRASQIITVSAHVRDQLVERGLVSGNRISVIHEAPTTALDAAADTTSPRNGYALMVGTLQPRKNHVHAARAWVRSTAARAMPLLIAGALGYQGVDIVRTVRTLDPRARVRFVGSVSDAMLGQLYRHASLLLQPSLDEGFGLPVLEAMRAGAPCVVSDIGALREVAANAALYVDPQDPEALTGAIDRVAGDPSLSARLRAAGRERAAEFSWARAATATLSVYDRLT
jgi:glycosyltransferase involved in cell wall biosynthesis